MWEGGICSNVEMEHQNSRYIKWEDILTWERTGTVTETDPTGISCDSDNSPVENSQLVVLQFDDDSRSYIERQPDMGPLQDALSVCAWVKKLQSGSNTIWFDYAMSTNGDAITLSDDEYWNTMVNQGTHEYLDMVTVTMGQWHHHCSTWKRSTGRWRVYHYQESMVLFGYIWSTSNSPSVTGPPGHVLRLWNTLATTALPQIKPYPSKKMDSYTVLVHMEG